MSRPSKAEQDELLALESVAALNAAIRRCCQYLGLRLRQAERRALGHEHILRVLGPSHDELDSIEQAAVGIHQLMGALLSERQAERVAKNGGDLAPEDGA